MPEGFRAAIISWKRQKSTVEFTGRCYDRSKLRVVSKSPQIVRQPPGECGEAAFAGWQSGLILAIDLKKSRVGGLLYTLALSIKGDTMKLLMVFAGCIGIPLFAMTATVEDGNLQNKKIHPSALHRRWDRSSFDGVKTLSEAVQQCRNQLKACGRGEYVALVTEEKWKAAILKGLESFRAEGSQLLEECDWSQRYTEALPTFESIVEDGTWPEGATVDAIFAIESKNVRYDGLGLRLRVPVESTPGAPLDIPIVDAFFGRSRPLRR